MIISNDCNKCTHYKICSLKPKYEEIIKEAYKLPKTTYVNVEIKCQEFVEYIGIKLEREFKRI